MTSPLASALISASDTGLRGRIGVIATTNPLVVTMTTGPLRATGRLASYTATVGHVVLVLVDDGGTAVVAGRVVYP